MRRVLVVEDDQWLGESYARVLASAGFQVARVPDADAAIDSIDKFEPDAILLDMLLTRTTGIALLHELQSHADLARIPVVVISSMVERLELDELRPYGVCSLIDKTTATPEAMVRIVERALG